MDTTEPIPYNYGTNIYYVDNTVYANGTPYTNNSEYYEQADAIATNVPVSDGKNAAVGDIDNMTANASDAEQWLPLGTFAILKTPDQKDCDRVIQLAVNKVGTIAGNVIDVKTDKAVGISGSVDPKTQRVAFKAKSDKEIVAECGLSNLTQDSLTMLLHIGKDKTEERTLVRLSDKEKNAE
jgi:tagatose-1,6-bisphosphate aldolase non-catalytic subunit AgaZ/GatZ